MKGKNSPLPTGKKRVFSATKWGLFSSLLAGFLGYFLYWKVVFGIDASRLLFFQAKEVIRAFIVAGELTSPALHELEIFAKKSGYRTWLAVGFFASFFLSWTVIYWWAVTKYFGLKSTEKHVRGSQLISPSNLSKMALKDCEDQGLSFGNGYVLGTDKSEARIPELRVLTSITIEGSSGCGKSTALNTMIAQDQLAPGRVKHLIIDVDGRYWNRFGRKDKDRILSLRHVDSELWDFWAEPLSEAKMAELFVPEPRYEGDFFPHASSRVLAAFLRHSSSLEELRELFLLSGSEVVAKLKELGESEAASLVGEGGSGGQADGVIASVKLYFEFLDDLGYWPKKAGKNEPFSLYDWSASKSDDSSIYVVVRREELSQAKSLISAWVDLVIQGCMSRDEWEARRGEYPSLRIVIDELASLKRIASLSEGISELRKCFGSIILAYQDRAKIESIYTEKIARSIFSSAGVKLIYRVNDSRAQEDLSLVIGETEVVGLSQSSSTGRSDSESESKQIARRRLVLPSEIGNLADFECFLKVSPYNPVFLKIPHLDFKRKNPNLEWKKPPMRDSEKAKDENTDSSKPAYNKPQGVVPEVALDALSLERKRPVEPARLV